MRLSAAAGRQSVPSTIAGRYRVQAVLGAGGAGEVYRVTDSADGRSLALKRLHAGAGKKATFLFEREYRTLAGLRHPHIVEVYEYGQDGESAFYTMELLEGADLSRAAPLPWTEVCACLRDVAATLGLLHARRLLHRDLSPRNLWRLPDGRIKLIDFGALTPFGHTTEVAGTPPFVAPESLQGGALDQRSDLYSLGALGYWLLTTAHAFPARSFAELPRLWQIEPAAPSSLAPLLSNRQLPAIPPEVDALISSLLMRDPNRRVSSTTELIDRLCTAAGLPPEVHGAAAHAHLHSKVFVGRERERERIAELLALAKQGRGQVVFVEAAPGMGRSRLLDEVSISARVSGALTVSAERSFLHASYGVANALALRLVHSLPEPARRLAEPHKTVLARLSPELRAALAVAEADVKVVSRGEERARLQFALHEWFSALCRERLIAVMIDDIDAVDEESQSFLAALALGCRELKLLLVATSPRDQGHTPAVLALRQASTPLRLSPLTPSETHAVFESLFGQVPYLARLSERLHRRAEGVPERCIALAEQLVHARVIQYADGLWSLPAELALDALPAQVDDLETDALDDLSPDALFVAEVLSLHTVTLRSESACAVSELNEERTFAALDELVHVGVLSVSAAGFRFAREDLRKPLCARLSNSRSKRAHLALGRACESGSSALERLSAGVHLLHAGRRREGLSLVNQVAVHYVAGDIQSVREAVPLFEEAVQTLHAQRAPDAHLFHPLSLLAIASYFVERRLVERYGDESLACLSRVLRLGLASKLRPVLGKRRALLVALAIAGRSLRAHKTYGVTVKEAVRLLLGTSATLCGVAVISLDPEAAARYGGAVEPLTALGDDHIASVVYQATTCVAAQARDRPAATRAGYQALIARLESGVPVRDLPDYARRRHLAGSYMGLGVSAVWLETEEALSIADRLDQCGPLYSLSADSLRASWHATRGDMARCQLYRQRVEMHAIQLGSTWQIETWAPADNIKHAMRCNDALLLKRSAQELKRLALDFPTLALAERRARGAYLVLRGRHAEALPLLDTGETPLAGQGWASTRGNLARALNGLGRHQRALEVCEHALSLLTPADLAFCSTNLNVSIEAALAHAGMGQFERAHQIVSDLLVRLGPSYGPLTVGSLYEARARVALLQGDLTACAEALASVRSLYEPMAVPTLNELVDGLERKLERVRRAGQPTTPEGALIEDDAHLITRVQLLLTHTGTDVTECARKGLQIAVELTAAADGFILVEGQEEEVAACASSRAPALELVQWAAERLRAASVGDETALADEVETMTGLDLKQQDGLHYCVAPLWARMRSQDVLVGAIALGFERETPRLPSPRVLALIAEHLTAGTAVSRTPPADGERKEDTLPTS